MECGELKNQVLKKNYKRKIKISDSSQEILNEGEKHLAIAFSGGVDSLLVAHGVFESTSDYSNYSNLQIDLVNVAFGDDQLVGFSKLIFEFTWNFHHFLEVYFEANIVVHLELCEDIEVLSKITRFLRNF